MFTLVLSFSLSTLWVPENNELAAKKGKKKTKGTMHDSTFSLIMVTVISFHTNFYREIFLWLCLQLFSFIFPFERIRPVYLIRCRKWLSIWRELVHAYLTLLSYWTFTLWNLYHIACNESNRFSFNKNGLSGLQVQRSPGYSVEGYVPCLTSSRS